MRFELDARLRAFAALARQGTFTAAAHELNVSQPAVSKHIADLELLAGFPLIVRRRPGVAFTEAGRFLADHVLRAEALHEPASKGLGAFAALGVGTLTVAASGTPGTYFLPRALTAFRNAHPGIAIQTVFGTSAEAVAAVRTHRAEIGLVGGAAAAPELSVRPLLRDEVWLVGPPLMAADSWLPEDLGAHTWIIREQGSSTRALVEAEWQRLGIAPRARLELPSWEAVKLAVADGAGITACSRTALRAELAAGSLVRLEAPYWRAERYISLVHFAGLPLSPAATRLVALLLELWA